MVYPSSIASDAITRHAVAAEGAGGIIDLSPARHKPEIPYR
ncbi:hypothetical protein NBRC3257_2027 [Gluconobacter thailandicus NBRC 3257]|uniref:Uncharacterized protein n=1 Tax=Gluconobacter thailandicus NBRC 3257 TaxID=1381097 RepID=A0ABQ0IXV2_GLUTH|nr:hypothetical protein NBRC3255_1029 [Gluconobacter thailandicus NBRC 3255]GAD27028.1 hypothetical protein NBRC3257_2027 [Gluconobacter thailandicus NBRC 3257]